jgi:hypothetical protein
VTRRTKVSWLDRALGGAGVILVGRLALAFAAAFITGGIVQRVLLGKFAFRAAGVELPEVAAAESSKSIRDLQAQIDIQQQLIDELVDRVEELE